MARGRAWILIAIGLMLAIGAGVLVFVVLQQQTAAAVEQARAAALEESVAVPVMQLPVAARQLEVGTLVTPADYVMKDFPLDLVPVTAISDTASLDSKVLISTVSQGETFHEVQFLGSRSATFSQQLEQGHVLFAFPIEDLLSQSDVINDGDRLDLLLTIELQSADGQAAHKATAITVQNITVLQVLRPAASEDGAPPEPTALLLSVTPDDAVMIKFVKDAGGTIDFVLRSAVSTETVQVPAVTIDELSERYGLR